MKNILITGGAGFVGSNLAIQLKATQPQTRVICLDNLKRRGSELNLPRFKSSSIDFVHGDIRNPEDLESFEDIDLILECSAEPSVMAGINSSPSYLLNTNLAGTLNCLELARRNSAKMLFLSTSRVYPIQKINDLPLQEQKTRFELEDNFSRTGVCKEGISEEFSLEGPRSLYGATKLSSELMIQEYQDLYGVESIINRCGVISGPWQMGKVDQGFMVLWVARHLFNKELSYIGFGGKGKQVRDVLHVDDLFRLIQLQISNFKKFSGGTFNVGGGWKNSVSLLELTQLVKEATQQSIQIQSVAETRQADIPYYITDNSKIQELSGWTPEKDLMITVQEIVNWIRSSQEVLKPILS